MGTPGEKDKYRRRIECHFSIKHLKMRHANKKKKRYSNLKFSELNADMCHFLFASFFYTNCGYYSRFVFLLLLL